MRGKKDRKPIFLRAIVTVASILTVCLLLFALLYSSKKDMAEGFSDIWLDLQTIPKINMVLDRVTLSNIEKYRVYIFSDLLDGVFNELRKVHPQAIKSSTWYSMGIVTVKDGEKMPGEKIPIAPNMDTQKFEQAEISLFTYVYYLLYGDNEGDILHTNRLNPNLPRATTFLARNDIRIKVKNIVCKEHGKVCTYTSDTSQQADYRLISQVDNITPRYYFTEKMMNSVEKYNNVQIVQRAEMYENPQLFEEKLTKACKENVKIFDSKFEFIVP